MGCSEPSSHCTRSAVTSFQSLRPQKPNVLGMKCLGRQHPHGFLSLRGGWSCSLGTQVMLVCRPAEGGPHCTPLLVTRRPGGEHVCPREAPGKHHAPPFLFRRTPRALPLVYVYIRVTKRGKRPSRDRRVAFDRRRTFLELICSRWDLGRLLVLFACSLGETRAIYDRCACEMAGRTRSKPARMFDRRVGSRSKYLKLPRRACY